MGHREVKRVSLYFSWPTRKIWKGYVNPHQGPKTCPDCEGDGYNAETQKISKGLYDFDGLGVRWCNNITQDEVDALVKAGRLIEFTRVPRNEEQAEVVKEKIAEGGDNWLPFDNGYIPSAEEVNTWNKRDMGHDTINRRILIEVRAKRLGVWGKCPRCRGKGELKLPRKMKKQYKKWIKYEPPIGTGWQLWETTSEGSPVSPVFATAEELASWCEDGVSDFGYIKTSKENWLEMFVGKKGAVDTGTMLVGTNGFFSPAVNMAAL